MNFSSRLRRNRPEATLFGLTTTPGGSGDLPPSGPASDVDQIAKKLAAFAGKEVAQDLALDLMLNDAVEQARKATGATGGAVALMRDGEMICRATTGKNAPDLGVRVDTTSGLPGAALITGKVQHCSDTEEGGLVNAEVCRRLGVRSMVIAPLVNGSGAFGILQVFSSEPHAFGEHEIETLEILAKNIAEKKVSVTSNDTASEPDPSRTELTWKESSSMTSGSTVIERLKALEESEQDPAAADGLLGGSERGVNAVLFLSVIVVALALGLVLGWHGAAKGTKRTLQSGSAPTTATQKAPESRQQSSGATSRSATSRASVPAEPPSGGLTITENGKVIYRSGPSNTEQRPADAEPQAPVTRLIRRVDPEYPEAAAAQHIEGPVVLEVQVLTDGTVGNVKILTGNPLLAEAAVKAVKQWQYQPFTAAEGAGSSRMQVTLRFSLPRVPAR